MTIVEAFKSGLPVRRPTTRFTENGEVTWMSRTYAANHFITVEDILADDWEVLGGTSEDSSS